MVLENCDRRTAVTSGGGGHMRVRGREYRE